MKLSFFVPGRASPGGSKRGFIRGGKVCMVDMGKDNAKWKRHVAEVARAFYQEEPLDVPLEVSFAFILLRPKKHYGTGRNAHVLRADAPRYPTGPPDTTKLIRAAEDACNGILWRDDSLIVDQNGTKDYGSQPGVWIRVWTKSE